MKLFSRGFLNKIYMELTYRFASPPWEIGPRKELVGLVETGHISPCRAIDLGCGTGANAIFLAQHGFEVTGVDFAPTAVAKAKRAAEAAGVKVQFVLDDLTNLQKVHSTFDFLVDISTLDDLFPKDRDLYVQNVLRLTHLGSRFLLWCHEWLPRGWRGFVRKSIFIVTVGRFAPENSLMPGEAERRFGAYFEVEHIAGSTTLDFGRWHPTFAAYLMIRAGEEGFEPSLPGPEPGVLPLDYSPVLLISSATDAIELGGAYGTLQSKSSPLAGLPRHIIPFNLPWKREKIGQKIQSLLPNLGSDETCGRLRKVKLSTRLLIRWWERGGR